MKDMWLTLAQSMDENLRAWTNGPERAHAAHDDYVLVLEASTWMFVPQVLLPTAEVSVWNRIVGRHRPYLYLARLQ